MPETIACPACDHPQPLDLPTLVDVARTPAVRQAIARGRFMRTVCTRCAVDFGVERELLYIDAAHGWFIGAFPSTRRSQADALAQAISTALSELRAESADPGPGANLRARVVFGAEALREKVLCGLHGLDDRALEALKIGLILRSPALRRIADPALYLLELTGDDLLIACHLPGHPRPRITTIPRAAYDTCVAQEARWVAAYPALTTHPHVHFSQVQPARSEPH